MFNTGFKNRHQPYASREVSAWTGGVFLIADKHFTVLHCRVVCPAIVYATAFEAIVGDGCFLAESAVPVIYYRRQYLFNFGQLFIGNGMVAVGLIGTTNIGDRN